MLRALAEGGVTSEAMADPAERRLRRKLDRFAPALDGQLAGHRPSPLGPPIRRLGEIDRDLAEVESAIGAAMRPFAVQRAHLATVPGVDAPTAGSMAAEIGVDVAAFGTVQRLAAWVGVCPAGHESVGKRTRRGTRKGDTSLKAAPVAAVSASRAKGTYSHDKFHRLKARTGTEKAATAVVHKLLVAVFQMLRRGVDFADLGADDLDRIDKHRTAKRPVRRLDALGHAVMLRPRTATA